MDKRIINCWEAIELIRKTILDIMKSPGFGKANPGDCASKGHERIEEVRSTSVLSYLGKRLNNSLRFRFCYR